MKSESLRNIFTKYYLSVFAVIVVFIFLLSLLFNYHFYLSHLDDLMNAKSSLLYNAFVEKYSKLSYALNTLNLLAKNKDASYLQSFIKTNLSYLQQDPSLKVTDMFFVYAKTGKTVSSSKSAFYPKIDLQRTFASSNMILLGPTKIYSTNEDAVILLDPVYVDGKLFGFSGMDISTDTFRFDDRPYENSAKFLYLYVNNDTNIFTNIQDSDILHSIHSVSDQNENHKLLVKGNTYFVKYTKLIGNMALYVVAPFNFAFFVSYLQWILIFASVVVIFFIIRFSSKSIINNIVNPLEKLKDMTSYVKKNPAVIDPRALTERRGISEIDSLYEAFFSMIEHIKKKNQELEASYEELESVFEDLENAYTDLDDKNKQLVEKQETLEKEHDNLIKAYSEVEISNSNLKKSLQELKMLSDISLDLVSSKNLKNLIRVSLEKLNSIFSVPFISVLSYDEKDNSLTVNASIKSNDVSASLPKKVKLGIGISGYAAMIKRPVVVSNTEEDPRFMGLHEFKSEIAVPIIWEDEILGVLDLESEQYGYFDSKSSQDTIKRVANMLGAAMKNSKLLEQLKNNFYQTTKALADAIEIKDPYTRGHSERVGYYSAKMAQELGFSEDFVERIKLAAVLHDIGKIGVRGAVLNKPGRLTVEERKEVEKHAVLGAKILNEVEYMKGIAVLVRHHHEYWNGRGYPDALKEKQIPLESRIISIADAFDAMTSDRPYRKSLGYQKALEILAFERGKQFDPDLIDAFLRFFEEGRLDIAVNSGFEF